MKRLIPFLFVAAVSTAWAQTQWEYALLLYPEVSGSYNIVLPGESYSAPTAKGLYEKLTGGNGVGVGLIHFLDVLGATGWELASTTRLETTGDPFYIFKRPR